MKTRDVRDGLKKIKKEKQRISYRNEHESDFIISDACKRYFKEHCIEKLPTRKALQAEIQQLTSEWNEAYAIDTPRHYQPRRAEQSTRYSPRPYLQPHT